MADRTAQPPAGIGLNSALSGLSPRFLWNAADPNINQIGGAASTSGLQGTSFTSGTGMVYRRFGAAQMTWTLPSPLPTGAYTLVVVKVYPAASITNAVLVWCGSGVGFRVEASTSGGGVFENYIHTGVAGSANDQTTAVGGFNEVPWVEVYDYNGTSLVRRRRSNTGVETGGTETIGYANPGSSVLYLGDPGGAATVGVAAVGLFAASAGATESEALRDNEWRLFEPEPTPGFGTGATLGALVAGGSMFSVASAFTGGATLGSLVGGGALSLVPGVVTVPELRNWSGALLTSQLVENIVVLRISDRAVLASFTNQTSNGVTGNLSMSQVGLVPGTACLVVGFNADGSAAFTRAVTIA